MPICLKNCGDCARYALRSKYFTSKSSDRDSLGEAISFGELISTIPRPRQ